MEQLVRSMAEKVASSVCGYTGVLFSRHYQREPEQGFTSREAEALHCYYRNQIQNNPDTFQYALRRVEELVKKGGPCVWCFAILATLYIDGIVYGYLKSEDHMDEAKAYVDRALAIDPQNQHAIFALAWWSMLTGDSGRTSEAIDRMIRVNPHSTYFKQVMAMGMCFLGDYQRSTTVMREVLENTPVQSWWIHIPHTITCFKQRDFREALFHARMIGRLSTIFDAVFEIVALYHLGEYDEMVNLLMRYHERFPSGLKHLRRTFSLIFHDEDLKIFLNDTIAGILWVVSRHNEKMIVNQAGQVQ
jgi:tetratricopeptide (TPR) repeat protein